MIQERLNMQKSFYKFLIDNILASFFEKHPAKKGDHYSIIIENAENRARFIDAIKQSPHTKPLVIENIYDGEKPENIFDRYETVEFDADNDGSSVPFIIADIDSGKEYLPTIRNAVNANRPYSTYATLFILSDYSVVETLATAAVNLESEGQPLNAREISKNISDWVKEQSSLSNYEYKYLNEYLNRLSSQISEENSDLFDFENVMDILGADTMKGLFNKLSYFNDKDIYGVLGVQDIDRRIEENAKYFDIISSTMSNLDEDAREEDLNKYFEPKLVKKILTDPENWQEIDFSVIRESANSKRAKSTLVIEKIIFSTEDGTLLKSEDFIGRMPEQKNKTKNSYIICREDNLIRVKITFNKSIKDLINKAPEDKKIFDRSIQFELKDKVANIEVGKDSNIHNLVFTKISTPKTTFSDFVEYIKVKDKGVIVINVPEDLDEIKLGTGSNNIDVGSEIDWMQEYNMTFSSSSAKDGKIEQTIRFSDKKVKFQIVFDNNKIAPKTLFEIFEKIWRNESSFRDAKRQELYSVITNDDIEFSTQKEYRILLKHEDYFIKEKVFALYQEKDDEFKSLDIKLPENVKQSLLLIYKYYQDKGLIPSLTYLDDEIKVLYKQYLDNVCSAINNIENGVNLKEEEIGLTKLGTVTTDNQVLLSPFHPALISFMLQFSYEFDNIDYQSNVLRLVSPQYLLPYISVNDNKMAPCIDDFTEKLKTWLVYEPIGINSHDRAFNITSKSVSNKLKSFVSQFEYLFTDDNCPILINTFGTTDDTNILKGIIEFIIDQLKNNKNKIVQRIEIHEYLDDLLKETFFEKLNRLNSEDAIKKCLEYISIRTNDKDHYTVHELVRCIFSKVSLYKHKIKSDYSNIRYSHITFFQMSTGTEVVTPNMNQLRSELSMNGLISIPSTYNNSSSYQIGFGTKGELKENYISKTAKAINTLYANEEKGGNAHPFIKGICIAKHYTFDKEDLLKVIYQSSNWVTFLNPEVDLEFFYKQDLYIVHYTDQYTINAKYDSITVTKHIDRYKSLLFNTFNQSGTTDIENVEKVSNVLLDHFNCLNGQWLLNISKQTDFQVREKISIVASVLAVNKFLSRNEGIIWVPISLDEILRVTGAIGLPKDYLFTKDALKANGKPISDDLLMMGVDVSETKPKVYLYPIEIKYSQDNIHAGKGGVQVANTYKLFAERLYGDKNFVRNVYRIFFASQFLTNLDKMKANNMVEDDLFKKIEKIRTQLLDAEFDLEIGLPIKQMGGASLITFNSDSDTIETEIVENVPICHININTSNCIKLLEGKADDLNDLLMDKISASDKYLSALKDLHDMLHAEENPFIELDENDEEILTWTENVDSQEVHLEKETNIENTTDIESKISTEDTKECKDEIENQIVTNESKPTMGVTLLVGNNKYGNAPIYFYPNNTRYVSHPNLGIIGTMGTGKTQFARSIIAQFSKEGKNNVNHTPIGMLVFDYKGDYNDAEFLKTVGGCCYKANYPFNPLKLCITEDMKFMNLPSITANRIADSISKAFGLGNVQNSTILEAILDAYAEAGITRDPSTWTRPAPTMQRVVDKYLEGDVKKDTVYSVFRMLQDYQIFTNDTTNCVTIFEWLKSVQIIDLTLYEDNIKKLIVSLVLDIFYAEMKQLKGSDQVDGFRELRTMILVDEAHQFMKMKFNSLRKIISEGRMFGVGMILSTQGISDFRTDEDYSTFIKSWVVHNVTNPTKSDLHAIFGPSDPNIERYMSYIINAVTFQSICKLGNQINYIEDTPYFKLIKTDERFKQ